MQSCLEKTSFDVELVELDVKWRVVVQNRQQEDHSLHKFVKKKTSCDVELVKLDVKWRVVVQDCQQEDDSLRKFVNKKTSFGVELDNSVKIWTYNSLRSCKVDDFGANRKGICDFLLVINSNFGPILHRFRDTAHYGLKIVYFSYSLLFGIFFILPLIWHSLPYLPFGISQWG